MKRGLSYIVLATAMLLPAACTHTDNNNNVVKSRQLMKEAINTACLYRDSIKLAKDSATVNRLMADLDIAMTKLNYRYPADIYVNSSENHNELLAKVTERIVELRDSILYSIAHSPIANDTVMRE